MALALQDSINLSDLVQRKKLKVDSLKNIIEMFEKEKRESPLVAINIEIRCRMKLYNAPSTTYNCKIRFDCDSKDFEVVEVVHDGIERQVRR